MHFTTELVNVSKINVLLISKFSTYFSILCDSSIFITIDYFLIKYLPQTFLKTIAFILEDRVRKHNCSFSPKGGNHYTYLSYFLPQSVSLI